MANRSGSEDHFGLFGLAPAFAIEPAALDGAWRTLQAQVHPDRHAHAGAAAQRVAMQWAARANEAYRVLRDPALRAAYLCERHGVRVDGERSGAVDGDFLQTQLELREALDEGRQRGDPHIVETLVAQVQAMRQQLLADLGRHLDIEADYEQAAAKVRRLMFVDRFAASLQREWERDQDRAQAQRDADRAA